MRPVPRPVGIPSDHSQRSAFPVQRSALLLQTADFRIVFASRREELGVSVVRQSIRDEPCVLWLVSKHETALT